MVGIGIECSGGGMSLGFLLKSPNGATVTTISERPNQKGYDPITLNGNNGQIKDIMKSDDRGLYNSSRPSSNQTMRRIRQWFRRNELRLIVTDAICIVLLLILHFLSPVFQFLIQGNILALQSVIAVIVGTIGLSVVSKGIVPIVICIFGIILIHNSVILPYYSEPQPVEVWFGDVKVAWTLYAPTAVSVGAGMNFYLGLSMVVLSIIIAYRPSLLFTRNRPDPIDSDWQNYPLWHDHTLLADGTTEYSVPISRFVTEEERYILWRYEYILANIYGDPHLVRPSGYVPKYSTRIYRDKNSGQIIGKARYNGFFT